MASFSPLRVKRSYKGSFKGSIGFEGLGVPLRVTRKPNIGALRNNWNRAWGPILL